MKTDEQKLQLAVESPDILCVAGSRLYGTDKEGSDLDLRGFVMPPLEYLIGIRQFNDVHLEGDHQIYSLRRWMDLALKGDPQCTELLFTPEDKILKITKIGKEVLRNRDIFLSKKIFWRIAGYSNSEWRKALGQKLVLPKRKPSEQQFVDDLRNLYKPDKATMDAVLDLLEAGKDKKIVSSTNKMGAKRKKELEEYGFCVTSAAHSIRLLRELEELLLTGQITFPRQDAIYLRFIRAGNYSIEEIQPVYDEAKVKAEEAFDKSVLPEKPDRKAINRLYKKFVMKFLKETL